MQGLQFNGDGTTLNTFGTVNIGGTIVFDVTGAVGTILSRRTAQAHCQSPAVQTLTYTSDRVHRRFGLSRAPHPASTGVSVGTATRLPGR